MKKKRLSAIVVREKSSSCISGHPAIPNFRKLFLPAMLVMLISAAACDLHNIDEPGRLVPKTVDQDPGLPRIIINGTELHGETMGDISNPIIVFLHGGPGSDYRALISSIGSENASRYPEKRTVTDGGLSCLQNEYFCIFFDQRGAGLSPRYDKGEVDFDLYIEDLDEIITKYLKIKEDETGITETKVYIVGWSYGGTLATGYINRHPDRVIDAAYYEPGPFCKKAYDFFISHTTSYFEQIGLDWLEEYLQSHDHFTPDSHIRADYQAMLGAFRGNPQFHENHDTPLWRYGALVSDGDLEKQNRDNTSNLGSFEGKMLFIGGEYTANEYRGYEDIQMACYPRSEYIEVSGTGHSGAWEKAGEVSGIIRTFFSNGAGGGETEGGNK